MSVRIFGAAFLFALIGVLPVHAQYENVRINQPGGNPEEVAIAINPVNPDNLVAGANLRYVFHSFDGGKSWTQDELPSGTWGDPCVIFDAGGRAYIANLVYGWDAIVVRHSDDGGVTWSPATKLFGPNSDKAVAGSLYNSSLQDKEWLISDMSSSPWSGNIYCTWTDFTKYGSMSPDDSSLIIFARSVDRGETFEPYVRISDKGGDAVDSDNTVEGAVPAVGPDGEIYVAWAGPEGLMFDRSFDGGRTWGKDVYISDQPGGWDLDIPGVNRSNGLPITVADISEGPNRGTVYVNWVDRRHGDHDVWIARSTDKGSTWSEPIRVNDDEVANGKEQFFTWASVDPGTGELVLVYYDRRHYSTDSTDVFIARSTDGGFTYVNTRISAASFYPTAMVFMGDYNCVAALNGRIRPIWTRLHDGVLDVYTALMDNSTGVELEDAPLSTGHNLNIWPNPVHGSSGSNTMIRFNLPAPARVQLTVHDILGRTVATLMDGPASSGVHTAEFDSGSLAPGTYICRLVSGDGTTSRMSASTTMITVLH